MLRTTRLLNWLARKRYQYEVTFSLYMLTPTEKFIFNSFLILFLSMVLIAILLYLPEHITTMASRAWFYYAGDEAAAAAAAAAAVVGSSIGAGGGERGGSGGRGGNVEGIAKVAVRTGAGAGAGAGVVLRRMDIDTVGTAGMGVNVGRERESVKREMRRMPGEEILELLGRL